MTACRRIFALICGLGLSSAALAEPLTCSAFRDRLNGALMASGDSNTEVPDYKDSRSTDTGGSHVNWDTDSLSGSLTCGASDRFQEFYVSLEVTTRERFLDQLKRLVSLDGATICSVATASPVACSDTGKLLLQDALQQMGAGYKRRVGNPSGTSRRMLWPDLKAELTAAPSLITFSMAVADGATADAARRALPPLSAPPKPESPAAAN